MMINKTIYSVGLASLLSISAVFAQTPAAPVKDSLCKLEMSIGISPMSTQLNSDLFSSQTNAMMGFGCNIDFAYPLFQTPKYKLAASIGLGYVRYNSQIKMNYNDSLWSTDKDEKVFLHEKADNLIEERAIQYFTIPIWLRNSFAVTSKLDVYLNVGMYYGMALESSYTSDAVLTRTGYYPSTHATIYDVDVAGSPYFYPVSKAISSNAVIRQKNDLGCLAAVGFKYHVNAAFTIFGGFKAINGFSNINPNVSVDKMVLSQNNGLLNTLMKRGDKVTTSGYGIEFGIAIKFKCKKSVEAPKPIAKVVEPAPVVKEVPKVVEVPKPVEQPKVVEAPKPVEQPKVVETPKPIEQPKAAVELKSNETINVAKVEKGASFKFGNVQFQSGTDILVKEAYASLDMLVKTLVENPTLVIEISGHTDNVGSDAANTKMSQKRADAVKKYLESKGVKATQLKTKGCGSTQPIADNSTVEGKAKNRRVEFKVLEK